MENLNPLIHLNTNLFLVDRLKILVANSNAPVSFRRMGHYDLSTTASTTLTKSLFLHTIRQIMELIEKTYAYCRICGQTHKADIMGNKDSVIGILKCPNGTRQYEVSTNPAFFLRNRSRSFYTDPNIISALRKKEIVQRPLTHFIDVTDTCNFQCPVCFASAVESKKPVYITLSDMRERIKRLRKQNVKTVSLFGGEPTVHPQIVELVSIISALGIKPIINTNGYLLGTNRSLVKRLKSSGLRQINLQFDTFNPLVHEKLRGNRHIDVKLKAIEHCINAGIKIGIVVTVTKSNISEIPQILQFALSLGPKVRSIQFQGAVNKGRFQLDDDEMVDREEIIESLTTATELKNSISDDDFWPFPAYRPWGLYMHPDCLVYTVLHKHGGSVYPLNRYIHIDKLYRKLHKTADSPKFYDRRMRFWKYLISSLRPLFIKLAPGLFMDLHRSEKIKIGDGGRFVKHNRKHSLLLVLVESFKNALFLDVNKTDLCPSRQVLKDTNISTCVYHSRQHECADSRISVRNRKEL